MQTKKLHLVGSELNPASFGDAVYHHGVFNVQSNDFCIILPMQIAQFNIKDGIWSSFSVDAYSVLGNSVLVAPNEILIFGGRGDADVLSTNVYLVNTKQQTCNKVHTTLASDCKMEGLWGSSAVFVKNRLYVYAGCYAAGYTGNMFCLNWETKEWSQIAAPESNPGKLFAHSGVARVNAKGNMCMTIFGGFNEKDEASNDIWEYDTVENTWTKFEPTEKPKSRNMHQAVMLSNDQMLIIGGDIFLNNAVTPNNDLLVYTFSKNEWTRIESDFKFQPIYCFAACYDEKSRTAYLHGGMGNDDQAASQFVAIQFPASFIKHQVFELVQGCKRYPNMTSLYEKQLFCDYQMETSDGKMYQLHKFILAASSTVLQDLILKDGQASKLKVHSNDFKLIVDFLYGKDIVLKSNEAIAQLANVATTLGISDLSSTLFQIMFAKMSE